MVLSLLLTPALAQTFSPISATPVLDPVPGIGWMSVSLGHPTVDYSPSLGRFYMVFESEVPGPPAMCPGGMTVLGLASSTDGISWTTHPRPLLPYPPGAAPFWACTARRPALRIDDVTQRLEVYFDTPSGIGLAEVSLDPATGRPVGRVVSPAPLTVPPGPIDALSVVQSSGDWVLAASIWPDIWTGTFSSPTNPIISTQALTVAAYSPIIPWVDDGFGDAALACSGSPSFPIDMHLAGWASGAWTHGLAIASNPALWALSTATSWGSGTVGFNGQSVLAGTGARAWRWYGDAGAIWLEGTDPSLGTPYPRTCP